MLTSLRLWWMMDNSSDVALHRASDVSTTQHIRPTKNRANFSLHCDVAPLYFRRFVTTTSPTKAKHCELHWLCQSTAETNAYERIIQHTSNIIKKIINYGYKLNALNLLSIHTTTIKNPYQAHITSYKFAKWKWCLFVFFLCAVFSVCVCCAWPRENYYNFARAYAILFINFGIVCYSIRH